MSGDLRAKTIRRLKRVPALLLAGFLMFAPPGTLIVAAVLIAGLVGDIWLVAGGVLVLVAFTAFVFLVRRAGVRGRRL